jgi:hypothetical protein
MRILRMFSRLTVRGLSSGDFNRKRWVHQLSITHKFGSLAQDRFDFLCGDVERDVHGALARAFPRSVSMSLWSLR